MSSTLIVILAALAVSAACASGAAGVFLGAWLYHRARAGQSPVPDVRWQRPAKPKETRGAADRLPEEKA
jgi:hypothetical protein